MKKILRYLLVTLIIVILFIAAGIMLLVNFVDPNDYRSRLDHYLSDAVKQPVIIHGDINWQFFPNVGLVLHDIRIDAQGDSPAWQAHIKTARIGAHLSPLLAKHFSLSQLILEGVNLDLTTATGSVQPSNNAAIALSPAALPVTFFDKLTQIDLQKLQLTDSSITIHQQLNQVTTKLDDIRFVAFNIGPNKTTDVQLKFSYQADTQKPLETEVAYAGKLHIDPQQRQINCVPCTLTAKLLFNNQLNVSTDIHYHLNDQSLTADNIQGSIDNLKFQGQLQAQQLNQDPEVNFNIQGATARLADLLSKYDIDIKALAPSALQNFSFRATGSLLHHQLTLQPITLQLDHSTLNGSIQSTDIENGAFSSQFAIDKINAQDYGKPATALQLAQLAAKLTILLPVHHQSFALSGPLSVKSLTIEGIAVNQLSTLLDMKGPVINFQQNQADLLNGHYQGTGQIDFSATKPSFIAKQTFTAIQIQPLIRLVDPALNISGIATINANFSGSGTDLIDFKKNLDADVKIALKNGVLYGLDAQHWLNDATLQNSALPVSTPFGDLTATLTIQNGVVSNQDLLLKNPQLRISGHGTIDLVRQHYDYHLLIQPIHTAKRFGGIPLWVTGNFSKPIIQLDTQALVQQVIKKPVAGKDLSQRVEHLMHKLELNKIFGN